MKQIGEGPNKLTIEKEVVPYIFGGSVSKYTVKFNNYEVTKEEWPIYRDALHNLNKPDEPVNKFEKRVPELCANLADPEDVLWQHLHDTPETILEINLPEAYLSKLEKYRNAHLERLARLLL